MMIEIKPKDKVLVITPHPDDESIGMGGFLAKYGSQCTVLLLTDGRRGNPEGNDDIINVRHNEFENAMKIANVNSYYELQIPDTELYKHKASLFFYDFSGYDYIFVPNNHEQSDDHRIVSHVVATRLISSGKFMHTKIIQYEVWTPMTLPNYYLDISDVVNKKKEMIAEYKSQLNDCDYIGMGIGLSQYRGTGHHCNFMEAYTVLGLSHTLERIYSFLPQSIREMIKRVRKNGKKRE